MIFLASSEIEKKDVQEELDVNIATFTSEKYIFKLKLEIITVSMSSGPRSGDFFRFTFKLWAYDYSN